VRCFDDDNITHVDGSVNPPRDVETINYELIFSDLELIDKRLKSVEKNAIHGNKEDKKLYDLLNGIRETLLSGKRIDMDQYEKDDREIIEKQNLLTTKPMMYAANVSEEELPDGNEYLTQLRKYVYEHDSQADLMIISAKIESEIAQLDQDERAMFLEEMGMAQSGLDQVIRCGYERLNLITFFTAGKKECRAWKVEKGTKAPQAAGVIHSDFERGFIRAEVTKFDKLVEAGNDVRAKELAYTKIEGKEYVVEDGDVIYFRFNV
jgi:GTP-binding protein YchF